MKKFLIKTFLIILIISSLAVIFSGCKDVNVNFVIEFESNGGTKCNTITSDDINSIRIPNDPEREHYTFDGWYWDDGTWQKPFTVNSILDRPISERMHMKVYAKWVGDEFTITLDAPNTSLIKPL